VLVARPGASPGGGESPRPGTAPDDEATGPGDRALHCAACRHRITDEDHRIERGGGHAHTFVNPGGFVHYVGCFALAPGVVEVGSPETAFSWFPGWSWQIVECARCRAHLGWRFRCEGETFWGLLVEKLVA
jgi:hypothetical protein